MGIKIMLAKIAARQFAKKLNLKEGNMESKKWFQSRTVWSGVVTVLLGLYELVKGNLFPQLPSVPTWVFSILGAFGVYGRVSATKRIE